MGYLQVKKLVFVQLISQKLRNVEKDEEGYACSCADALQRSQYIYTKNECCQGTVSISNFVAKGSITLGVQFFKASQDESKGAIKPK